MKLLQISNEAHEKHQNLSQCLIQQSNSTKETWFKVEQRILEEISNQTSRLVRTAACMDEFQWMNQLTCLKKVFEIIYSYKKYHFPHTPGESKFFLPPVLNILLSVKATTKILYPSYYIGSKDCHKSQA